MIISSKVWKVPSIWQTLDERWRGFSLITIPGGTILPTLHWSPSPGGNLEGIHLIIAYHTQVDCKTTRLGAITSHLDYCHSLLTNRCPWSTLGHPLPWHPLSTWKSKWAFWNGSQIRSLWLTSDRVTAQVLLLAQGPPWSSHCHPGPHFPALTCPLTLASCPELSSCCPLLRMFFLRFSTRFTLPSHPCSVQITAPFTDEPT